ncbi:golgi uridine diphosphate-N- acetylglucosamine transporter [Entomortierella chlamydospora]|uniref:Golgi uridine diphosphate-N- acetylglucosamine transporter n=1 Tax=Entomortierella chlamydospora TaxID=101097 RepID=A0A9P6MMW2_9FUNG|nr:golgi uridine diphosphate-N- acetylglucosamine transporter [Entomortierella chlamydospora]
MDRTTIDPPSELRHRGHGQPTEIQEGQHQHLSSPRDTDAEKKELKRPQLRSASWSTLTALTLQVSLQDWILIATMIFGGCCSNVFALEILVNDAPKSGQMITFAQFAFVSIYGLFMHLQWPIIQEWLSSNRAAAKTNTNVGDGNEKKGSSSIEISKGIWRYIPHLKERRIPIVRWISIVVMFFAVSVLNNWSLAYKISVPLHIIFRSGGLMVGMVLGMILMKKRYSKAQIFSVLIVTIGVIVATTSAKANTPQKPSSSSSSKSHQDDVNPGDYAIGVFMLSIALIVSSLMGLLQESTYKTYGSEWREGLFYSIGIFNRSTPIPALQLVRQVGPYLPTSLAYKLSSITIPRLWIFLAVNTLTQ